MIKGAFQMFILLLLWGLLASMLFLQTETSHIDPFTKEWFLEFSFFIWILVGFFVYIFLARLDILLCSSHPDKYQINPLTIIAVTLAFPLQLILFFGSDNYFDSRNWANSDYQKKTGALLKKYHRNENYIKNSLRYDDSNEGALEYKALRKEQNNLLEELKKLGFDTSSL